MASAAQPSSAQSSVAFGRAAMIVWGILLLVVGYYFLTNPITSALFWVQVMAIVWLAGGIFDLVVVLTQRGQYWVWRLLGAIISILAGLYIISNPILGALFTVQIAFLFIAISAIIDGAINIVAGFRTGAGPRWSGIILGVVQLIVGVWLLLHPIAGMLALLPAFGLLLIASGIIAIIAAFRLA